MDYQDKQGKWWHWKSKGPELVVLAHIHRDRLRRAFWRGACVGAITVAGWHLVCFILIRLWRAL